MDVGETRRRDGNSFLSVPRWEVWRTLGFRFLTPADGSLDQAVYDLDRFSTDFDSLAADYMGLGQNRPRPWIADHNSATLRKTRLRGGRSGMGSRTSHVVLRRGANSGHQEGRNLVAEMAWLGASNQPGSNTRRVEG